VLHCLAIAISSMLAWSVLTIFQLFLSSAEITPQALKLTEFTEAQQNNTYKVYKNKCGFKDSITLAFYVCLYSNCTDYKTS